jgi:small subunit ribosomal protein S14
MAKLSSIDKNKKRLKLAVNGKAKRDAIRAKATDRSLDPAERFQWQMKLAALPRNYGNLNRVRNRCELTGRPRGYYRRFKMSRIALRELGSIGQIPGLTKSSW